MTSINRISDQSSELTVGNTFVNANILKGNSGDFTLSAAASSDIVISNGTSDVAKIYNEGSVTYPLNPAFLAYNSTDRTNVTGNGAEWTVILDTEILDANGDFASNTFTAPRDCIILLKGCVTCSGVATAGLGLLNFLRSSGLRARTTWNVATIADASGNNGSIYYSILIDMDAADTVQMTFEISGMAGDTATVNGGSSPLRTWCAGFVVA